MAAKKSDKLNAIGEKIKRVRLDKKFSLDQVANETGHSLDYLKAIESGEKIPPVGDLLQIARALEIESGFFLKEQEANLEERVEAYTKRTDNYAYTTLTPGAENKHLKAFKVRVEPHKDHGGVGYLHEGEEFNYVLSGNVEVVVGDHVNKLGPGDSLHFNSGIQHQLRNVGDAPAELIVVIYGP